MQLIQNYCQFHKWKFPNPLALAGLAMGIILKKIVLKSLLITAYPFLTDNMSSQNHKQKHVCQQPIIKTNHVHGGKVHDL